MWIKIRNGFLLMGLCILLCPSWENNMIISKISIGKLERMEIGGSKTSKTPKDIIPEEMLKIKPATPSRGVAEEALIVTEEMRLLMQLVEAEAGNQDLYGRRYVVDVVLNRVDSDQFPNTIEEVIYQPNQFSVVKSGALDLAADHISDETVEAVLLEWERRLNYEIIYFSKGKSKWMTHAFKHQDHWFGW